MEKHMTNKEWIDLISEQFDVSRSVAKKMLHEMMKIKQLDTAIKKMNEK